MNTVRKDIKEKIERMEKLEREKRKNENIHLITAERDFFRQEAMRLNQLCKGKIVINLELSGNLDELSRDLKFKESEYNNLLKKWKESENSNKQLISELSKNIQINQELEDFNSRKLYDSEKEIINHGDFGVNNFDRRESDQIYNNVIRLQNELKKEKAKTSRAQTAYTKILMDKNNLEKIFIDCVEECRKEILHRKLTVESMGRTTSTNFKKKHAETMPIINDIKYEQFLPSDKRKIIEEYILRDDVINLIKEYMFKKNNQSERKEFSLTQNSFIKGDRKLISINSNRIRSGSLFKF
jgi:hypothetical protein